MTAKAGIKSYGEDAMKKLMADCKLSSVEA